MNEILLAVFYYIDGGENRHTRYGEVQAHVGNKLPTEEEMQQIMFAAKMEYGRLIRRRKTRVKEESQIVMERGLDGISHYYPEAEPKEPPA